MKAKRKLDAILEAFKELKRLFVNDKVLCEVYDEIGKMARGLLDTTIERKHQLKNESRDACEKLRSDIANLENQLFTTKVETETLKIDKKYYEDQMADLQKKNQEMIANIENIMTTEPKRLNNSTAAPLKSDKPLPPQPVTASKTDVTGTAPKKEDKMPSSIRKNISSSNPVTPLEEQISEGN